MNKFLAIFLLYTFAGYAEDPYRHYDFHNIAQESIPIELVTEEKHFTIKVGKHFFRVIEVFHDPMCHCSDEDLDEIYALIDSQKKPTYP